MGKYFGTDGIRGIASTVFTAEKTLQIGQAIGLFLNEKYPAEELWVGIGRDSRTSGELIEQSLITGLLSTGVNVKIYGILPTPGIARLVDLQKCHAGIVISASHNPAEYNGIKVFSAKGQKLTDHEEKRIEHWMEQDHQKTSFHNSPGKCLRIEDATKLYADSVIRQYPQLKLHGLKVAVDCSYGATCHTTPYVLRELGAEVFAVACEPLGEQINHGCGSTFPQNVEEKAKEAGFSYDIAFSHDGDGDRVLARYKGRLADGDHMLTMIGMHRFHQHQLCPSMIVGTVMTNTGIERYLQQTGIQLYRSSVGDKYVLQDMIKYKAVIGGEQSGHLIFMDKMQTGDGLISILETLQAAISSQFRLLEEVEQIPMYSQELLNVTVTDKEAVLASTRFADELKIIASQYPDVRIVVRPSGTEPLFRILTEAQDPKLAQQLAKQLADIAINLP